MRRLLDFIFLQLKEVASGIEPESQKKIETLARRKNQIENLFKQIAQKPIVEFRIRLHGDYHLGQLLVDEQGELWVIDFEGTPVRPLSERRIKRSPLQDVATMLWSFYSCVHQMAASHVVNILPGTDRNLLMSNCRRLVSVGIGSFPRSYFNSAHELPPQHPPNSRIHDAALFSTVFALTHMVWKRWKMNPAIRKT